VRMQFDNMVAENKKSTTVPATGVKPK
jgi:hypothetical protein